MEVKNVNKVCFDFGDCKRKAKLSKFVVYVACVASVS